MKLAEVDELFLVIAQETEKIHNSLIEKQKKIKDQEESLKAINCYLKDINYQFSLTSESLTNMKSEFYEETYCINDAINNFTKNQLQTVLNLQEKTAKIANFFDRTETLEKHIRELSKEFNYNYLQQEKLKTFTGFEEDKYNLMLELEKIPPFDYLQFENQFRGSETLITSRQSYYLKYFEGCNNILDIGCGRGEFVELAKKNNISATGIDLEVNMQLHCKEKGLEIESGDIFPFLFKKEDGYYDGIFSSQVIEHLTFRQIQQIAFLFNKKTKSGSYIVIETINPQCNTAFKNFYIDLTHQKPLFPNVLKYLFQSYGLKYVHTIYSVPLDPNMPEKTMREEFSDKYMDYAIIVKKE